MHLDVIHYRKLLPPQQGFERRRRRPSLSSALYFTGKFERRLYWAPLPPQQGFHPCCGGANPYCGGAPWFRWRRNFSWQIETLKPSCRRHRRLSICQMMAMVGPGWAPTQCLLEKAWFWPEYMPSCPCTGSQSSFAGPSLIDSGSFQLCHYHHRGDAKLLCNSLSSNRALGNFRKICGNRTSEKVVCWFSPPFLSHYSFPERGAT